MLWRHAILEGDALLRRDTRTAGVGSTAQLEGEGSIQHKTTERLSGTCSHASKKKRYR